MCLRWLIVCFLCGRYNISHFYKDRLRPLCPLGKIFHTLFKNLALVLWYLSNEYKRVEWLPVPKMSNTDDQIFLTKKQCIFFILVKGQLISKCLFGVFNFFQKMKKNTSHTGCLIHRKYLQFLIVSTFHCNLAVRFAFFAKYSPM